MLCLKKNYNRTGTLQNKLFLNLNEVLADKKYPVKKQYFFYSIKKNILGYDVGEMTERNNKKATNDFLRFSGAVIEKWSLIAPRGQWT